MCFAIPAAQGLCGRWHDHGNQLGVLAPWGSQEYNRRFAAPVVIDILLPR